MHLRLLVRARDRRLRVELPPRRRVRGDPDQRRPGLRVRQRPPGAHRARRARRAHCASSPRRRPSSPIASPPPRPPPALRTFRGRPGYVPRSWGPGWALVGDAGYFKDPLSAHGLTDALRDAELLARPSSPCSTAATSATRSPPTRPPRRAVRRPVRRRSTSSPASAGPTPRSARCCCGSTRRWPTRSRCVGSATDGSP